jgi:hypothetical protein
MKASLVIRRSILSATLPERGDSLLWYVEEDGFRYSHLLGACTVRGKSSMSLMLVVGPLMLALSWGVQ